MEGTPFKLERLLFRINMSLPWQLLESQNPFMNGTPFELERMLFAVNIFLLVATIPEACSGVADRD